MKISASPSRKNYFLVSVDAGELRWNYHGVEKVLPYGTTIGVFGPRGVKVWMPAASTPRGYKDAARAALESARSQHMGNKNPVRRRGNLVIVSGPHSHAYPARKTHIKNPSTFASLKLGSLFHVVPPTTPTVEVWRKLLGGVAENVSTGDEVRMSAACKVYRYTGHYGRRIKRGNKNPLVAQKGGFDLVENFTRGVQLWKAKGPHGDWMVTRNGSVVAYYGPGHDRYEALALAASFASPKKRRRNMGVSDLVNTPAYGAFGGSIAEGKYNGGPMHWMRRGIRNPKGAPRVNVRKVGPQMWRVSLPSRYVPGDGVPYGIVEKRGDQFYYSGPTSHGEARYPASSLSNAVLKMLSAHASWIGHGTRQRFMEDKRRGNPLGPKHHGPVRRTAVFGPKGRSEVTNLGWLLRNAHHVDHIDVYSLPGGRAQMVAHLDNGGAYETQWESMTVLKEWVKRRALSGIPVSYKNPLVHGYSRKSFGKNVKRERGRGVGKKRALAIAFTTGRRAAKKAGVRMPKFLRRNPADATAARELVLYIENDGDLYRQQTYPIIQNLARKKRKGTFDFAKSVKLWAYLAENGAKKYAKEFGGTWNVIFTPDTRRAVAAELAQNYLEAIDYEVKKQSGNKNPRYRQSPPGAPSLAASRASNWRSLTTSFPGASISSVTARGNPSRRRKKKRNTGEMSFWRATIYSPTGKPIHRQVIQNTRAGAVASARKLARSNPKVALDGPFKTKPAC